LKIHAYVKIREYLSSHKELAQKIKKLEEKYSTHDEKIHLIFEAIKQLIEPPEVESKPKLQIGFKVGEPRSRYKIKKK